MLKQASQPLRAYFNGRFEALNSRATTLEITVLARLDAFSDSAMDIFTSLGRSSSKLVDTVDRLETRLIALSAEVADLKHDLGPTAPSVAEAALVHRELADVSPKSRVLVLAARPSVVATSLATLGYDTAQVAAEDSEPYDVVISLAATAIPGADVRRLVRPDGVMIVSQYHEALGESHGTDSFTESEVRGRRYLVRDADGGWTVSENAPNPGTTAIVMVTAINSSR